MVSATMCNLISKSILATESNSVLMPRFCVLCSAIGSLHVPPDHHQSRDHTALLLRLKTIHAVTTIGESCSSDSKATKIGWADEKPIASAVELDGWLWGTYPEVIMRLKPSRTTRARHASSAARQRFTRHVSQETSRLSHGRGIASCLGRGQALWDSYIVGRLSAAKCQLLPNIARPAITLTDLSFLPCTVC